MTISIITITLHNPSGLRETLRSVAAQRCPSLEHIVVDGTEDDTMKQIVAEFPNVRHIYRKPGGVYDALNAGIEAATGDIIGLVHAGDCLPAADVLSLVLRQFESDPELNFVYGDLRYFRASTHRYVRTYGASRFKPYQLTWGMAPPHPTLYIRRDTEKAVGPYRTDFRIAADFEHWIKLFSDKSLKYRYIPHVLAEMATGGLSSKFKARLFTNNSEKYRALKINGIKASPWRLCLRYALILREFIAPSR